MPPGTNSDTTSSFPLSTGSSCPHAGVPTTDGVAVIAVSGRNKLVISQAFSTYLQSKIAGTCGFELNMTSGSVEKIMRSHSAALIIDITCNGTAEGTISILDLGSKMNRDSLFQLKSVHGRFIADELKFLTSSELKPSRIIFVGIEIPSLAEIRGMATSITDYSAFALNLSGLIASVVESLNKNAKVKSYSIPKRTQ